jgi:hypothetical protein
MATSKIRTLSFHVGVFVREKLVAESHVVRCCSLSSINKSNGSLLLCFLTRPLCDLSKNRAMVEICGVALLVQKLPRLGRMFSSLPKAKTPDTW